MSFQKRILTVVFGVGLLSSSAQLHASPDLYALGEDSSGAVHLVNLDASVPSGAVTLGATGVDDLIFLNMTQGMIGSFQRLAVKSITSIERRAPRLRSHRQRPLTFRGWRSLRRSTKCLLRLTPVRPVLSSKSDGLIQMDRSHRSSACPQASRILTICFGTPFR